MLRKNPAARLIVTLLATAAFLQPANNQTAPLRPPAATEDAVRLSAFEVSISRDVGYPSANAAEASRTTIPIEHLRGRFRGTLFDRYTFGRSAMPGLSLTRLRLHQSLRLNEHKRPQRTQLGPAASLLALRRHRGLPRQGRLPTRELLAPGQQPSRASRHLLRRLVVQLYDRRGCER